MSRTSTYFLPARLISSVSQLFPVPDITYSDLVQGDHPQIWRGVAAAYVQIKKTLFIVWHFWFACRVKVDSYDNVVFANQLRVCWKSFIAVKVMQYTWQKLHKD